MFEGNSTRLTSYAKRLLALVGSIIADLPNDIAITGHTAQTTGTTTAKAGGG